MPAQRRPEKFKSGQGVSQCVKRDTKVSRVAALASITIGGKLWMPDSDRYEVETHSLPPGVGLPSESEFAPLEGPQNFRASR